MMKSILTPLVTTLKLNRSIATLLLFLLPLALQGDINKRDGFTIAGGTTYTVVSQLDVEQDNGGVDVNNEPITFDATNETYSSGSDHTNAVTPTKVEVYLKKTGSPTGELTLYLYEPATPTSEGVPDDRVATADATLSMSSISTGVYAWYEFLFTGASELTAGNHVEVVLTVSDGTGVDASNYIQWAGDNFLAGSWSMDTRATGAPAATNDAANWSTTDGNGAYYIKVYESP